MPWKIQQPVEHEIKFRILPRFQLSPNMGYPIPPRVFTPTYFDTEQHRLGQLGLTLRKRVERSHGGVWQLKIPSGAVRLELEIDSSSRRIPWEFQDLLMAFFRKQEAIQLGKLRTKRQGVRIQQDNQIIAEVAQDSVALIKDKTVIHTFQELEIELQEDTAAQLKPIRKILPHAGAQEKPFQPKIFQALQLPYPLAFEFRDLSAPATDQIRERLHSQYFQILRHDPGTRLGRDSEALHQMRVVTRRIRAILRAVRSFLTPEWTDHVRRKVGWIGSLLGEVREWDVLLEYFRKNFHDFSPQETNVIRRFAFTSPSYDHAFKEGGSIHKLDCVLTSVGTINDFSGLWLKAAFDATKLSEADFSALTVGNMTGCFLPKSGLSKRECQILDRVNERWLGIQVPHLRQCAERATRRSVPGVVLTAIGAGKTPIVLEAIRHGLVNVLCCDFHLAKGLESALTTPPTG